MTSETNRNILLIDLPTFPKGVIALSLLSVAASLSKNYKVAIDDLNIIGFENYTPTTGHALMYGLKVSSQNVKLAIALTEKLKSLYPKSHVIWGGELPSLLPDYCLQFVDTIVGGLFDSVADTFMADLETGVLQQKYFGENNGADVLNRHEFQWLQHSDKYNQFMGFPMETSRGCTEKCIFCMVHVMQKKNYNLSALDQLKSNIHKYRGKFVNIVDYNFGVSSYHVIAVSKIIKEGGAIGWMAEMCIELLDNDEMLLAMQQSNCKMIYCGLESIDQQSLRSVHKTNTNHIENYERIIRKVQSYGIQVAAGIILGLEGTHPNTFEELFRFYQRMGIIYAKLTFLTYNPGTKVHEYEKKKGTYVTPAIEGFDGNQLSFLPHDVDAKYVATGTAWFIQRFYSIGAIIERSFKVKLSLLARIEYVLFNIGYRQFYFEWLKNDTLQKPENIQQLMLQTYQKSRGIQLAEHVIQWVRKNQIKH